MRHPIWSLLATFIAIPSVFAGIAVEDPDAPMSIFTDYTPLYVILGLFMVLTLISMGTKYWPKYRKYGSKKFLISIAMILSTSFLTWTGKMGGGNAAAIFSVIGCGYGILNVLNQGTYDPELVESDTLLSRKFIIAIMILSATTVLGCYNDMEGTSLLAPILTSGGLFGITNVWGKKLLTSVTTTGKAPDDTTTS